VIGRDSKDWNLAVEYLKVLESSGRKELEQWERELRGWDPSRAVQGRELVARAPLRK
jgi:hypothetical protein